MFILEDKHSHPDFTVPPFPWEAAGVILIQAGDGIMDGVILTTAGVITTDGDGEIHTTDGMIHGTTHVATVTVTTTGIMADTLTIPAPATITAQGIPCTGQTVAEAR